MLKPLQKKRLSARFENPTVEQKYFFQFRERKRKMLFFSFCCCLENFLKLSKKVLERFAGKNIAAHLWKGGGAILAKLFLQTFVRVAHLLTGCRARTGNQLLSSSRPKKKAKWPKPIMPCKEKINRFLVDLLVIVYLG